MSVALSPVVDTPAVMAVKRFLAIMPSDGVVISYCAYAYCLLRNLGTRSWNVRGVFWSSWSIRDRD